MATQGTAQQSPKGFPSPLSSGALFKNHHSMSLLVKKCRLFLVQYRADISGIVCKYGSTAIFAQEYIPCAYFLAEASYRNFNCGSSSPLQLSYARKFLV